MTTDPHFVGMISDADLELATVDNVRFVWRVADTLRVLAYEAPGASIRAIIRRLPRRMGGMVRRTDAATRVEVTGAIIAGGTSRRMGVDKRGLLVQGIPLLRRVASILAAVSDELVVSCRRDSPPAPALWRPLGARLVFDRLAEAGPLAGVEAALAAAEGELVLVAACDMPWLAPDVLRLLLGEAHRHPEADAVALRTGRGPEPLLCVYRRRVLPTVTRLLDGGERRMHALLAAIPMREVPPAVWRVADPGGRTAVNMNVPTDLTEPGAGS